MVDARRPRPGERDRRWHAAAIPGVAANMFSTLEELGIQPEIVSTSPIKIGCFVPTRRCPARGSGASRGVRARPAGSGPHPWLSPGSESSARLEPWAGSRSSCSPSEGFRQVRALASERSAGSTVLYGERSFVVEKASAESLGSDLDLCFFSVGTAQSAELVPRRSRRRSRVRRQVFGLPAHRGGFRSWSPRRTATRAAEHEGIVANPNCSTIQLVCALAPLHEAAGLRSVRIATYQSASGAGAERMEQLRAQEPAAATSSWTGSSTATSPTRSRSCAPNAQDHGAARSAAPRDLRPRARPDRPLPGGVDRDRAAALPGRGARGAGRGSLCASNRPADAGGTRSAATRCWSDASEDTAGAGLALWVVCDNLRKGAALNAIQIAELAPPASRRSPPSFRLPPGTARVEPERARAKRRSSRA